VWSLGESKQKVTTRNKTKEPPERCPSDRQPKQEVGFGTGEEGNTKYTHIVFYINLETSPLDCPISGFFYLLYSEKKFARKSDFLDLLPVRWYCGNAPETSSTKACTLIQSESGKAKHYTVLETSSTPHSYLYTMAPQRRIPFSTSILFFPQQVISERYVVLFSFHLLILALDNLNQKFIYEGILPLSAIHVQVNSQKDSTAPPMFEISGTMVDSKIFICNSAVERKCWLEKIEDRIEKSQRQQLSLSHSALSYLLPCDERWKKEELKRYLLRSPIWQWEGTPIHHMGQPAYLSVVHISNIQREARLRPSKKCFSLHRPGSQERLFLLFPLDLLILSVDRQRVHVKYEGRLPRKSISALERSALPGRLEFELTGELMEPLLVSCAYPEDYQSWIFQLQQPEKVNQVLPNHASPPLIPRKHRSSREA
ncbi:hypothetical protein P4O66_022448, partial [Electrophorus voltai]